MIIYYLNGVYLKAKDAKVSITDRGFKFGDSVFETIGFERDVFFLLDEHLLRLKEALFGLKIDYDLSDIKAVLIELLTLNSISEGSVRITISRGELSHGYMPAPANKANIAIEIRAKQNIDYTPKDIVVSKYRKPSAKHYPTQLKTCQGLNSTLAIMDARDQGYFDALLLNDEDVITETTSANIFWVKDNKLFTPALSCSILPGTMRAYILKNTQLTISEVEAKLSDIKSADYIFLTNSNYKLMPVGKVFDLNGNLIILSKITPITSLLGIDI
ncbi:MAG: hypothetical protein HON23_01755 [Rickettsiales bacterium]|jgi:branched-subunit amino acid aminotransferase/4-amino-4-deoxychorismate lyase|nr:hypothetical protein [Rickettsiales bacterium]